MIRRATLHTDGGSRGNPGPAGFGFVLVDEQGSLVVDGGWFLARATNNVAEYSALIWGLRNGLAAGVSHIKVFADSELMVKQMQGVYKVKSADLKPLHMQARELFARFDKAEIAHVYRSENKEADALANATMDTRGPVGSYKVPWDETPLSLFDLDAATNSDAAMRKPPEASQAQTAPFVLEDVLVSPQTQPLRAASVPAASIQESTLSTVWKEEGGKTMELNQPYTGPGRLAGGTYESRGGTYELTVKDHFDAAHALPGYDGPCQYLHGHTWDVEVTIVGQHLDAVGILYDFKDIKRDLHAILDNFDHHCINDVAPFDHLNPTAEHMARVVYFELENTLPVGISLKEVAIWESPAARVAYRP